MGDVRIYKIDLTAGDISQGSPSYQSSTWGGVGTPRTDYPEIGEIENIQRSEGAGASGQDVLDALDPLHYAFTWITLCGIGPLTNGQFDCRGGGSGQPLKVRWKQFFSTDALAENDFCAPLVIANGGVSGAASGQSTGNVFVELQMNGTGGAGFQWVVSYRTINGSNVFASTDLNPGLDSAPGTADDAEHEMIVTIVPSTVTGAYNGNGSSPGSATVATDGSITVTQDGVTVISGSSLKFVINPYATTNPAVYYGKTLWHGD